jgi:hypothetical protein
MKHLEHPELEVWQERQQWFENQIEATQGFGSYILSEQACALTAEVQATFCTGAWAAVLILTATVIEAQLREEVVDFKVSAKGLIDAAGGEEQLHWLRKRRNSLIHSNPDKPALTVDQQWAERDKLEQEAREAIGLMLNALFMSPGT